MKTQPSRNIEKKSSWGGARAGAGRPKSSEMVSHTARPRMGQKKPTKIELKIRSGFPELRDPLFMDVFQKACQRARRFGLRIIEFSVLPKRILLICEIKSQEDLEKSFKSLNTTLAIFLKKWKKERSGQEHKGPVFLGRFTIDPIDTPDKAKLAIREVLLAPSFYYQQEPYPDDYSSAPLFKQWKLLLGKDWSQKFEEDFRKEEIERCVKITATPQFWLNQSGWKKSSL